MRQFVTFTTYSNEDAQAMPLEDFESEDSLPEDWAEWVIQEATDESCAVENHDDAFDKWQNPD